MDKLEKLKEIMKAREMGYEELSKELDVSFQTVYRWFKGEQKPCKWTLKQIDKFIKKHKKTQNLTTENSGLQ